MSNQINLDSEICKCFFKGNSVIEISEYLIAKYGQPILSKALNLSSDESFEAELADEIDSNIGAIKILEIIS